VSVGGDIVDCVRRKEVSEVSFAADPARPGASPALVALALGIVYVVWGSTYLAIRIMVRDLPPLSSAGWRFGCGAVVLGALLAGRSGPGRLRATRSQLLGCALLGFLLPAGGNGLVSIGEHLGAPSGIAALLVASVPLWVIGYRAASGDRPSGRTIVGVLVGFGGLLGLIAAAGIAGEIPIGPCLVVLVGSVCWSFGSWKTPRLSLPPDPFVVAVYEMAFGAVFLMLGGALSGEDVFPRSAPADAWLAWGYLVIFGSVIAFTAYAWVLDAAPISLVATYAYVNPVVAVLLGWLVLAEPITPAILVGGAVVVAGVALVINAEHRPKEPRPDHQQPTLDSGEGAPWPQGSR
jgi:drug/metabolite transporter (DMT)-like permease